MDNATIQSLKPGDLVLSNGRELVVQGRFGRVVDFVGGICHHDTVLAECTLIRRAADWVAALKPNERLISKGDGSGWLVSTHDSFNGLIVLAKEDGLVRTTLSFTRVREEFRPASEATPLNVTYTRDCTSCDQLRKRAEKAEGEKEQLARHLDQTQARCSAAQARVRELEAERASNPDLAAARARIACMERHVERVELQVKEAREQAEKWKLGTEPTALVCDSQNPDDV